MNGLVREAPCKRNATVHSRESPRHVGGFNNRGVPGFQTPPHGPRCGLRLEDLVFTPTYLVCI